MDKTFENGLMGVPRIMVTDFSNFLFRNFITFQQFFPEVGTYFTTYYCFMDLPVNTSRDVQTLNQFDIIEHGLGSDEEITTSLQQHMQGDSFEA